MLYLVTKNKVEYQYHLGEFMPNSIAHNANLVQADGDELVHILRDLPELNMKLTVHTFIGNNAVRAALTFIEHKPAKSSGNLKVNGVALPEVSVWDVKPANMYVYIGRYVNLHNDVEETKSILYVETDHSGLGIEFYRFMDEKYYDLTDFFTDGKFYGPITVEWPTTPLEAS